MRLEILWFVLGVGTCLGIGAGAWIVYLIAKTQRQKKRMSGLMFDKGVLTMRVGILEDALNEKGQ